MRGIAVGIDVGGTNLRGALISSDGKILKRRSVPSEADKGMEFVVKNLLRLIRDMVGNKEVAGIGIGIAGIIDQKKGVLTQAPNIANVRNYPIRKALIEQIGTGIPVFLENDANCAALGENWVGSGRESSSLVVLTLGTGVGGGIILGGKLWRGEDGMAGEIGHITVDPDGPRCNCGNYGCLESFSSASALRRRIKEVLGSKDIEASIRQRFTRVSEHRIPEVLRELALKGDKLALSLWDEFGRALGIAIASLVNLLNVDMIVIGGGLSNAWELFIKSAIRESRKRALRAPIRRVRIEKSALGSDAGIFGAGYLVFEGCNGQNSQ
jgi:glucokinase